jgi:hypothetical protein
VRAHAWVSSEWVRREWVWGARAKHVQRDCLKAGCEANGASLSLCVCVCVCVCVCAAVRRACGRAEADTYEYMHMYQHVSIRVISHGRSVLNRHTAHTHTHTHTLNGDIARPFTWSFTCVYKSCQRGMQCTAHRPQLILFCIKRHHLMQPFKRNINHRFAPYFVCVV